MKLYLETGRPGPLLYLSATGAQLNKSVDPVMWARKFDHTNGGGLARKDARVDATPTSKKQDDQLYLTVKKSSLGDDGWLNQFAGTPLFDQAADICDELLKIREERLEGRNKPEKAPVHINVDNSYSRQDKLQLKKDRLELELARLRNKKIKQVLGKLSGTEKSANGKNGQEDLSDILTSLFGEMPGENLKKKGSK